MPASITIALVELSPKVIGKRIEMPARGPMPGSTPTSVPTRQPRNAYHSTAGCSATEKTKANDSKAPIIFFRSRCRTENRCPLFLASLLETQYAGFERRFERGAEHPPGDHRQPDAVGGGTQNILAFDHHQQSEHEQRHRQDEAKRLIERRGDAGNQYDEQRMITVAPVDLREQCAARRGEDEREAEHDHEHEQELRHHPGARRRQGAERQVARKRKHRDREHGERSARDVIGAQSHDSHAPELGPPPTPDPPPPPPPPRRPWGGEGCSPAIAWATAGAPPPPLASLAWGGETRGSARGS